MVALRMPIHVPPCALVALPAATDTWLGNAYLDCPRAVGFNRNVCVMETETTVY